MYRFKDWRLKAGLTQQEVANFIGISNTAVVRHEGGQRIPAHETIMALAGLYEIPSYALFTMPRPVHINPPPPNDIPNILQTLRTATRLTGEELGRLVGVSALAIRMWEMNAWGLAHQDIISLARIFKVPTYRIFVRNPYAPTHGYSFDEDRYWRIEPSLVEERELAAVGN